MNRKELIAEKAEEIAELLGIEPGTLARNDRGLVLSPAQIDKLLSTVFANGHQKGTELGFKNAIDVLREAGDKANAQEHNHITWAVYVSAASFLEGQTGEEVCKCRCMQGSNCGGCGHEGCGYTA